MPPRLAKTRERKRATCVEFPLNRGWNEENRGGEVNTAGKIWRSEGETGGREVLALVLTSRGLTYDRRQKSPTQRCSRLILLLFLDSLPRCTVFSLENYNVITPRARALISVECVVSAQRFVLKDYFTLCGKMCRTSGISIASSVILCCLRTMEPQNPRNI